MNRPYTICYIMTSAEGNIDGDHWRLPEAKTPWGVYNKEWEKINPDATIYGATTVSEFASNGLVQDLPAATKTYPREDYIAPYDVKNFYIFLDTKGTLAYKSKYIERKGRAPHAVIHVLTEDVSDSYLEYLRSNEISYIFCGKKDFDAVTMMQKAYSLFNIKTVVVGGGGLTNWTFLTSGLIDEYKVVLLPIADGDPVAHAAFHRSEGMESKPVPFTLVDAKPIDGDGLMITYKAKNALPNE